MQTLHGFQAKGSGGIVQAEHVRGQVHEDTSRHGMSFGNVRKKFAEDGAKQAGDEVDESASLADFHDAEP